MGFSLASKAKRIKVRKPSDLYKTIRCLLVRKLECSHTALLVLIQATPVVDVVVHSWMVLLTI